MDEAQPAGTLYVVSTPIGHLGDLAARAVGTLARGGVVLAEDTRHSRTCSTATRSDSRSRRTTSTTRRRRRRAIVERLLGRRESLALISDAGTPLLSDPGRASRARGGRAGVRGLAVPGRVGAARGAGRVGAGAERFTFFGFLPRKGAERARGLAEIAALRHTPCCTRRRARGGDAGRARGGGRGRAGSAVARELTKQFEEVRRGTVAELAAYYDDAPPRGEVVIVIAGPPRLTARART